MVKNIIKFSLENRLLVMVITVLIIIAGIFTVQKMDVDVFPDLTAPTVVVMTEAPGMAPEEVEKLVSFPLETAVNGSTGIRRVRSSSALGFSILWVEFDWSMDVYKARQIVSEKLQSASEVLPEGVGQPTLMPQASLMGEIYIFAITSDTTSAMDLHTMADWVVRPRLLSTNGVAQVTIFNEVQKEYQVLLDQFKMSHYGISVNEVVDVLKLSNENVSGGYVEEYGNQYILRGIGRTSDVKELKNSVIKLNEGLPIKLSDISNVKIAPKPRIGDGSYNGKSAVVVLVTKQPNVNTLELTNKIDQQIEELKTTLPTDIEIHTDIFRQADFIGNAVNNVQKALIEGGILVVIILLLFLMNVRTTFISLVSIPISLIIAVLVLKLMGLGINTMVLGGMAIAIGSLVDDAIVDVENVYKRLRENSMLPQEQRLPKIKVIYNASLEIRSSIVIATLIIIAAFVPLFFLSGMEGRLLRPLGITYIVSLFASLLVAMTVTNVLETYLFRDDKKLQKHANGSYLERILRRGYVELLHGAMKHKVKILSISFALLIGAIILLFSYGRSFLPSFNEGTLTINVSTINGISVDEGLRTGREAELALLSLPEISTVERRTGRAELAEHSAGINVSEIDAPFILKDRSREEFMDDVRAKLSDVKGISYEVGQPITHRINHMLSGTRSAIAIKLFGTDLKEMYKIGNIVKDNIDDIEGLVDIMVEQQVEIPQIQIIPKRDVLANYGIKVKDFLSFVKIAFAGENISSVFEGERSFDLVIRYPESDRNSMEAIKNSLISTPTGEKIPLHYVSNIKYSAGPNTINRENVRRKLVISANVADSDVLSVVTEIKKRIDDNIVLPENYNIEYGGQFESEAKASRTLMIASILAIFVIFILLYQEFKNLKLTSIVLLNLPLALIGGVIAISLSFNELNIPAIIGFITLFGIATRNGILLVSRYQSEKTSDKVSIYDAIIYGSADRLIPILMTALTAALALIPLAMGADKPGNEIQSPMAIVILGGLLSSTLLNIFVVPIIYYLINNKKELKHEENK